MSAQILTFPNGQRGVSPRHNNRVATDTFAEQGIPAADPLQFANWLLGYVVAGHLTLPMAEAICRYQEQAACA